MTKNRTSQTAASPVKAGADAAQVSGQHTLAPLCVVKGQAENNWLFYRQETLQTCPPTKDQYLGTFTASIRTPDCGNAFTEFIVRACNSHDILLAALKQLVETPEVRHEDMEAARAAIARAEGGK